MLTLYHYEHCPYCVRVVALLQMAGIEFKGVVLLNDDEATPISMVGKKMLPILQISPAEYLTESLDIIDYLCQTYDFPLVQNKGWEERVESVLSANRLANYGLSMPRWVDAPLGDFATASAKRYFIRKKTQTIGDFEQALDDTDKLKAMLIAGLEEASSLFNELFKTPKSKAAIMLFSGFYGIHYVEDFDWPESARQFMMEMSALTRLSLETNS